MRLTLPLLLAFLSCKQTAPQPAVDAMQVELSKPLPVDASVRIGTLDNGFTYYIEQNDNPEERAVMRLIVDAGSVLEDEDQQGIAHLLEHMAFNGSEHFDGNELIEVMQDMGMKFGAHVNAHTSFDETVYKLTVPTAPEQLDKALLVFEDWAGGMTLETEEIDKERGVVIEEWRRRLGPGQRMGKQTLPLTFHGSPYPDRLPIGTLESLQGFKPEAVRRFYKDWYRPELMALVVVGDIDVDAMEAQIKQRFGKLKNPENPRERTRPNLPDHEPLHLIITDPELPRTSVSITLKRDDPQVNTHATYREGLLEGLVYGVLNERLATLSRKPGTPFLGAGFGPGRLTPTEVTRRGGVGAREGQLLPSYEAMLTEMQRLSRHGATQAELDRTRTNVLRMYDGFADRQKDESSAKAAAELIRVHTTKESLPGTEYEVTLARRYLPTVTLQELSAVARRMLTEGSKVVTVSMPDKEGVIPPTVADLKAIEAKVAAAEIAPPAQEKAIEPPIAVPTPGSIVATDTSLVQQLGFTKWTLSNGMNVYWKNTDLNADQVVFRGSSPGGLDLYDDKDWVPASSAVALANRSGVGELDVDGLMRWRSAKQFNTRLGISSDREWISGNASPKDLEHALTLMHAQVVAPRFDPAMFELEKEARAENLRNRLMSPNAVFSDAVNLATFPNNERSKPWTLDTLDKMNLARSEAIYRERFADLHDMDFVVVGALPDDFERLVTTWVATLPGGERNEVARDRGNRPAMGRVDVIKNVGTDPKAQVRMRWHGAFEDQTALTRNRFMAVDAVLTELLRERLREELSGVYGVSVSGKTQRHPAKRYSLTISFTCDPSRADELAREALAIVDTIQKTPVDARYIEQLAAQRTRTREENVQTNNFWLGAMSGALNRGEDPVNAVHGYADRVQSLTAAQVQQAAKRFLSSKDFVYSVRLPEKGSEAQ